MDNLQRKTCPAAAWPDQKINFFSEDEVLYFSYGDINLCLSVSYDKIQFSSQNTTHGIDFIQRNLDPFDSRFGVHVAASGEVINGPYLDRFFFCRWCCLFGLGHHHGNRNDTEKKNKTH